MIGPDQVKEKLLELDELVEDFNVIYSGKESNKVDGLYKPEPREIVLHNRNFKTDNELMYTAIHEFAHHIQFTGATGKVSSRAHTVRFWDIFHKLLFAAEEKDIFHNIFKENEEFQRLTMKIKRDYLEANGEKVKAFGGLLLEAMELCRKYHTSFEDYVDRELGLHRSTAKSIINTFTMDITPEIGYENMKYVAGIKDEQVREMAQEAFLKGKSPDMVKAEFSGRSANREVDEENINALEAEKKRIKRRLDELVDKLSMIDEKIETLRANESESEMEGALLE